MKMFCSTPSLVLVAAVAFGGLLAARADEATQVIKFSDPSKPGTVKISLGRGELQIQGADTSDVTVTSNATSVASKPRKDGMRVLTATSSFSLKENANVVSLDASMEFGGRGNSDFRLNVPRNTTVVIQNGWGGDVKCSGLNGDIEINSMHGDIQLEDIAGGVVVGTMNGQIHATIRELNEGRPLSFTSMNGEVLLRVPENAKANVRLRTQNGSVLTDFDESALVTKTEAAPGFPRGKLAFPRGNKVLTTEIQDAIREATQLSATAIKEALEAVKEGLEAARLNSEDARRQMEDARREMERARRERRDVERKSATVRGEPAEAAAPAAPAVPAKPAIAPMGPKPPIPTITGGKLVTGTLNGGGPEISVSTMNGDVILKKRDAK